MNKFLLILLLISTSSYSQEPLVIDLQKDSRLIEIINLKEKGNFLITGKDIQMENGKNKVKPGDLDTHLVYISSDLKVKWNKPFPLEPDNMVEDYYVACSDSFIYFIEILGATLTKSNYLITQIDYAGVTRIFEYNVPFKIDKLYDLYCDKDYLYFFYDEFNDSKKPYHFLGISHSNFQVIPINIALPKILKKKEELSYQRRIFTGINNDLFYFYSKSAKSSNDCSYEFSLVNKKGVVDAASFILDGSLDNGQYIAPTNNPHLLQSWTDDEFNFYTNGDVMYPGIGSLGDIFMDFDNQCIYLFGNYNKEPFNNTGGSGNVAGIFVNKFDINGKSIWKKNIPFPKEAKDPLLKKSLYSDRQLFFKVLPKSGTIIMEISFVNTKKRYSFFLDKMGNYMKMNSAEIAIIPEVERGVMRTPQSFKGDMASQYKKLNMYIDSVDTPGMRKLEELSKLNMKKVNPAKLKNPNFASYSNLYHLSRSTKSETLIESDFGEGKIKLYLFPY